MRKSILNFGFYLSIFLIVFSGCKEEKKKETEHVKTDCNTVHWTYKGEHSPDHWKDLCTGFSACGGQVQSPVDITAAEVDTTLTPIDFEYAKSSTEIVNNGHTIQFNISPGNKIMVKNKEYELLQFHFHTLSEHTVNGEHSPIEIHFVHRNSDTDFAVVSALYDEGEINPLFEKYLANFPKEEGKYTGTDSLDLTTLLPANKSYYNYNGSLTTPPCSEVVNWYIMKNTIHASKEQIDGLSKILHNNYRPVMSLNDRKIKAFEAE